ncbi:MAG TPA: hypothetical protein VGH11_13515 [Jatrophihabitans sp.]|jgi:hypothetical protein
MLDSSLKRVMLYGFAAGIYLGAAAEEIRAIKRMVAAAGERLIAETKHVHIDVAGPVPGVEAWLPSTAAPRDLPYQPVQS